MPDFENVAKTADMPADSLKTLYVKDTPILLANVKGKFLAIGAICTHRGCDLSEGTLQVTTVVCACHGARWNLETGTASFMRPLPDLPVYATRVADDNIQIKIP